MGDWKPGIGPDGHGKLYEFDTEYDIYYDGEWKDGNRHGYGKQYHCYFRGILEYEGEWQGGKYHGYGKQYNEQSGALIYEGIWARGIRHGYGISYDAGGVPSYRLCVERFSGQTADRNA
jgi:antitoxin component YwqK of YwqJK toxin-antitoxin module